MPKATCRFCRREFDLMTWDSQPRFPQHRLDGSYIACDGSGEFVSVAGQEYSGPLYIPTPGKIEGFRGRSIGERIDRSKQRPKATKPQPAPSFYDKEEMDEWREEFRF